MVNSNEALVSSYRSLFDIMQKQYAILQQEPDTEQLKDFDILSTNFAILTDQIDRTISDKGGYGNLDAQSRRQVEDMLLAMEQLGVSIEDRLQHWYDNDSIEMRQVKTQQTTLRSYGGVNYSDSVALYIDEKK